MGMTMSMHPMSSGDGYRYLLGSVVAGDGDRALKSPLTRYYEESGTPPGVWLGTGLAGVGLSAGADVTEDHLRRLIGEGCDPLTGAPLGRKYNVPTMSVRDRVAERMLSESKILDSAAPDHAAQLAALKRQIVQEERGRARKAVAGFDCTFSVPKSVSTLWAAADEGLKAQLVQAHHEAIADTLKIFERDVARTRVGQDGVAQVEVRGVLAAAYDHWDSRAGDPQLHTHVVVANRVQGADGKWRTLDSRLVHKATVAMSEAYDALLTDRVAGVVGARWEARTRARSTTPRFELVGVPEALMTSFSQRSAAINQAADDLVSGYQSTHGGARPSDAEIIQMRQKATLTTRPGKHHHSLADLNAEWQDRIDEAGFDPKAIVDAALPSRDGWWDQGREPLLRASDLTPDQVTALGAATVAGVEARRTTWTEWNLRAEASRHLMPYRFASDADRDDAILSVTSAAAGGSVLLTAPELASTPRAFVRSDGSSAFARPAVYSSVDLLGAEAALLQRARTISGPRCDAGAVVGRLAQPVGEDAVVLDDEQQLAVHSIATSGRVVDVLVGPAGTGKTVTLAGMRAVWEARFGAGSVVGLAPSAAAAEVLGDSLGIGTENTAKWLTEAAFDGQRRERLTQTDARIAQEESRRATLVDELANARGDRVTVARLERSLTGIDAKLVELGQSRGALTDEIDRWSLHPGQVVIVDEASLAGTFALDRLTKQAADAGAKVVLVGDPYQLAAVDAGGAFRMLVGDRTSAPELSQVRRFRASWEKAASVRLRVGDTSVLGRYESNNRVFEGDKATMVDAAYGAWRAARAEGQTALLIAADNVTVSDLNGRARADLIADGVVQGGDARTATLRDGNAASVGDTVMTRQNDRTLATGERGFVKNGDLWDVRSVGRDGSLTVGRQGGGGAVVLPRQYVDEHVELGYAVTAHRAQGATVDAAFMIAQAGLTREVLYVGMTRGKAGNSVFVATDEPGEDDVHRPVDEIPTGHEVLVSIMQTEGAERSATDTAANELEQAGAFGRIAAEYDTIARAAQAHRWDALIVGAFGEDRAEDIRNSPAYDALAVELRRADALGLPVEAGFGLIARKIDDGTTPPLNSSLTGAHDAASVLHGRVQAWVQDVEAKTPRPRRYIAGLVPEVTTTDPEFAVPLAERADLMRSRADELVERALAADASWIKAAGQEPTDPVDSGRWRECVGTVAAYRERHAIDGDEPIGPEQNDWSHANDARRATAALDEAIRLADQVQATPVIVPVTADRTVTQVVER